MDGSSERLLPGTEGAAFPFCSPDNKSIAFFADAKLQRVEITGGAPLPICVVNQGRGGAWTSDHRILFGSKATGLFEVLDSGGTPSPLTVLDTSRGEAAHRWPQLLPGGRFLYWVQGKADIQGVYAASLARPAEGVRLASAEANGLYAAGGDGRGYLLWLRGATLVAQELNLATLKLTGEPHQVADSVTSSAGSTQMNVAASAGGLLLYSAFNTLAQFTWMDRTGKRLSAVGEPGEYDSFRLSPDELRVAVEKNRLGGASIWLVEVERGVSTPFTSNPSISGNPVWSLDSRTIVSTFYFPTRNLFRKDASGAGAEQRLTQSPNPQYAVDWSRDGCWILYSEKTPSAQSDLWVLPMTPEGRAATDATAQPYLCTPDNEWGGRFSPEQSPRWVAYQSHKSGHVEVYIDSFPQPRGGMPISKGGGTYSQWGAGGRELFYVSPDFKLMVVDLKLTADSVKPSAPRELFPLPAVDTGNSPYDTSLGGGRFLVRATPEHGASQPLTVIVNWPALLKEAKK